jgi:hypothetical protein
MDQTRLTPIRNNADLVITTLGPESGVRFGLNRESVAWVEGFIEDQRGGAEAAGLSPVLACFLGEAIIGAVGGTWADDPAHGLGVRFTNGDWCYPFAKVAKQFENGKAAGDGVLGFYDSCLALAKAARR